MYFETTHLCEFTQTVLLNSLGHNCDAQELDGYVKMFDKTDNWKKAQNYGWTTCAGSANSTNCEYLWIWKLEEKCSKILDMFAKEISWK